MKSLKKPLKFFGPLIRNFQNKYLLSLLITAIAPLLVTLVLVLSITHNQMEQQQVSNLLEKTHLIQTNLNSRIEALNYAQKNLDMLVFNHSRFSNLYGSQNSATLAQFAFFRDNLSTQENIHALSHIQVFCDRIPYLQHGDHFRIFPLDQLQRVTTLSQDQLNKHSSNQLNYLILRNHYISLKPQNEPNYIVLYNNVYSGNDDLMAIHLIYCNLNSFLDCAAFMDEGSVVISTADGEVICSNTDEKHTFNLMEVSLQPNSYILKNHHLIARYNVPRLDWTLTVAIPVSLDVNVWQSLGGLYLSILLATFLLALFVGILVTRLQTRRLQVYLNAVRDIDYSAPQSIADLPDRLDQRLAAVRNPDEIDHLMQSFSTLVRDNLDLISNMKQHDLEIEKYKFKVLQEQINPHFLYNALETLRLCMLMGRREDALSSLDSLSRFYRIALSKGRDTISIQEELDMIRNYLTLENVGYNGAIQWTMDVDEECLDMPIPKFLLQPLVENSILHSKTASGQSALKIDVLIHHNESNLSMIIRDNGSGIDAETLASIQEGLANNTMQKGKNGFGLSNVNRRLKLFYGSEYGLEIQSRPGNTENIIILPIDLLW